MLLEYLFSKDFIYLLRMDENRAMDGLDLRYRFCYEKSYEYSDLSSELRDKPCSVLEMMVALALRCEEQIMADPDAGDRLPYWFERMIANLGLTDMDDYRFELNKVEKNIETFLHREYLPNGLGGLFYIPNCQRDLRHVEIWYQACWYLDSIL